MLLQILTESLFINNDEFLLLSRSLSTTGINTKSVTYLSPSLTCLSLKCICIYRLLSLFVRNDLFVSTSSPFQNFRSKICLNSVRDGLR